LTDKTTSPSAPTPPPKWVRATQLINQLDGEIRAHLGRNAVPDTNASTGRVGLRILEGPPESLSLLLGDALQNLHSALDHEVYRQATAHMGAGWAGLERCAFPTFDDPGDYAAQRKRLIGGLRSEVQTAIDRFQVCDSDPEPAAAKIRLLNELSRIDRHRLLHLTTLNLEEVDLRGRAPGQQDAQSPLPPPPDDGFIYVDVRMTLAVRFVDGPAAGQNIIHTLNDLTRAVAATVEKLRIVELRPATYSHPGNR
jgi:hypothetical protein